MKIRCYILVILLSLGLGVQPAIAEKKVKLLTLTWEPYVGLNMPKQGISASIVRMAFEKAGYKVDIQFLDWDTALQMAKEGKADGLFPTYLTEERKQWFLYSDAFGKSPLGLCKMRPLHSFSPGGIEYKKDTKFKVDLIQYKTDPRIDQTQALRELKQYKFGVGQDYANTPEFDAADFLEKVVVKNDEDNILQLLQGDVEIIVIDKYVAKNIIAKKFPWRTGDIEFMEPPLSIKDLYLAIPKGIENAEEKMRDFNLGLGILMKDGTIDKLLRVYGF